MNSEDAARLRAEREASPTRWHSFDPNDSLRERWLAGHPVPEPPQQSNENEPQETPREEVEETSRNIGRQGSHVSHSSHASSSSSSASSSTTRQGSLRPAPTDSTQSRAQSQPDGAILRMNTTRRDEYLFEYLERHPTAVKRIQEHRLQHSHTVGTTRSRPEKDLPAFGGGKEYPPLLPDREEYVVEFEGPNDPKHPQNWPLKTKLIISCILVFDSLAATFASAVFSPASTAVGSKFHVGREVTTLGTSLFVLGYAFGPIAWAPISELYGRRKPVIAAATGFGIFMIAVSVAKDIQTLLICRFFAGLFGSCALTIVPAVFSDIYNNEVRGLAVAVFSAMVFNGPLLGPMIGGFITKSYLGWRWTQYIPSFMGFACAVLALLFQQESYPPIILVEKASVLRRMTRNWGIHAKQEEVEVDLKEMVVKNVGRPLRILFLEPIVLLVTFYMSFLYGILYLSLTAYSITFGQIHGFAPGISGLPYIGMIVGVMIGFTGVVVTNSGYVKKLRANNNIPVPEWRLFWPMLGGISFAAGLFWFGWTGYKADIPWIVPTLAGLALGFGIYTVFLQLLNYIIDSYLMFAASAIAANTFMRSLFGAIFPLFASYMYDGIGINWGMTFLGCLSTVLIPMPFIFYFFGKKIRAKSKFAPAPDIEQDKRARNDEAQGAVGAGSDESGNGGEKRQD